MKIDLDISDEHIEACSGKSNYSKMMNQQSVYISQYQQYISANISIYQQSVYIYIYIYIHIYIYKITSECHSQTTPSSERR